MIKNLAKMQKKPVHNVAVVRLRLFSYTKAGGVRTLYPLKVATVRLNHSTSLFLQPISNQLSCFMAPLRLPDSPHTLRVLIVMGGRVQSCFHARLSVHQFVLSRDSSHASATFSETGEKGGG